MSFATRLAGVTATAAIAVAGAFGATAYADEAPTTEPCASQQAKVDKAEAAIAAAGFDAEIVQSLLGPARAAELIEAIPVADRQDAITACIGDTKWMNWLAALSWYSFAGDIEKALGTAQ